MAVPVSALILTLLVETPSSLPPEELEVLLAACSRARAPGVCVSANSAEQTSNLRARVEVDERRAELEVTFEEGTRSDHATRELVFEEEDSAIERARALGLLLALLAKPLEPLSPPPEEALEAKAPPATAEPKPAPPPKYPPWLFAAGFTAHYDPSLKTFHYGPQLRVGYEFLPALRAEITGMMTEYPPVDGLEFLGGRALAGLAFRAPGGLFEPYGALGASLLDVHEGDSNVHAHRYALTFDLGLRLRRAISRQWLVVLSPHVSLTPATTHVSLGPDQLASTAIAEPGLSLEFAFLPN